MKAAWDAFCSRLFDQNKFAIKLGLENISKALDREGHPELSHRRIVIGGTNGKGSTAALVSNLLQASGLKVGLYTSPHLIELRERFRVDGVAVSQEAVLDMGRHVLESYAQPTSAPRLTFFELTTLMAAKIFEANEVDVAIYEVGLGGRLDAVNAIKPNLTIITSIDVDHTQYLGETIAEIAAEKAGLLRAQVPAVITAQKHTEARNMLAQHKPNAEWAEAALGYQGIRALHVGTALKAVRVFLGHDLPGADRIVRDTQWPGRQQVVVSNVDGQAIQFVVDAAHNPAGMRSFAEYLKAKDINVGAFILGAMADKDLHGLFKPLNGWDAPRFTFPLVSHRAASPQVLREVCQAQPAKDVRQAISLAAAASHHEAVVVCGSIYLLGEFFDALGMGPDDLVLQAQ